MKYIYILFLFTFQIVSESIIPYSKIDNILKNTWDDTFPIPFNKILKKDLLGKGILYIYKPQKEYIYSFKVYVSEIEIENGEIKTLERGKEVIVKLYYSPSIKDENEKKYRIELGEFSEKNYLGKLYKWVK